MSFCFEVLGSKLFFLFPEFIFVFNLVSFFVYAYICLFSLVLFGLYVFNHVRLLASFNFKYCSVFCVCYVLG